MASLSGKVAFVTGAGRGIGWAVAERFIREGALVGAVARTEADLLALQEAARGAAGDCLPLQCDVADEAAVGRAAERAQRELGDVEILVNNAGVFHEAPFCETGAEVWQRLYEVNVLGAVHCLRALLPPMLAAGRGRVVNVCSTAGHKPYPGQSAYCASKHALLGLTRTLAAETSGTGVRVHAVSPGGVDTRLVRDSGRKVDLAEYMQPEEIADIVLFLAGMEGKAHIDDVLVRRIGASP